MKLRCIDGLDPAGAASGAKGHVGFPGALNMGIDEALVEGVASGRSLPTLRFYSWSPPCVTIGYFQSMKDEVDLDACTAFGVDAVRRVTGGGAVFHDAEITYSLVVPEGSPLSPSDILVSYERICDGLVRGLALLGVAAAFAPINDLHSGGRKISGNAQTRKKGCLLQHGTLLLDLDVERMFRVLKVPAEKMRGRLVEDVKARVTSLRSLCGREIRWGEAALALGAGFQESWAPLGIELFRDALSPAEMAAARRIAAGKYSAPEWNLKR